MAAAILLVITAAFSHPEYRVERSITVPISREKIFPLIGDLNRWSEWSPWTNGDPTVKFKAIDPITTVGSKLEWTSERNGFGGIEVTHLSPPERLGYRLAFGDWNSTSSGEISISTIHPGESRIEWSMVGRNDFSARLFWLLFRFQGTLEADFDRGLQQLRDQANR